MAGAGVAAGADLGTEAFFGMESFFGTVLFLEVVFLLAMFSFPSHNIVMSNNYLRTVYHIGAQKSRGGY
ncbi:MAG: hypothetical protein IKM88_10720, partial [Lachnospiraceae bacterium]|nr:hypothetical protein [Lachnospiraceae bacterium]